MNKKIIFSISLIFCLCFSGKAFALENGVYEIENALSSDVVSAQNANIVMDKNNNKETQKWIISREDNGYYTINSLNDGKKRIDVANDSKVNGGNVVLWNGHDGDNQKWMFKETGDGYYNIISKSSGLYLNANNSNINIWENKNNKNQKFKLKKLNLYQKTIEEGLYEISSALDNKKNINISGEVKNGTNIDIMTSSSLKQKWNVKYLNNGFYVISSFVDDSKVLDVYKGLTKNGTNINLWSGDGSATNQQWLIKDVGDGYYNIVSRSSGLNVDISNGSTTDGTNILLWNGHNGDNQKFRFTKVEAGSQTIEDGLYEISSIITDSKVLSLEGDNVINGTLIKNLNNTNSKTQKWNIKYLNNGFYSIVSYADSGKTLDVKNGETAKGNNLQLWSDSQSVNQQWLIKETGDGYFNIISRCNGLSFDVSGGSTDDGAIIALWEGHNGDNQKYRFTKISEESQTIQDGLYTINSLLDTNMVIGLDLEMAFNGTKLQLESFGNLDSQKWYVNYIGDGYYNLTSALNGGKVVDVPKSSYKENIIPELFSRHNGANQQWIIKDNGNGSYSIISSYSNLSLEVDKNLTDGSISLKNKTESDSQKFVFNETTLSGSARVIDDGYYKIRSGLNLSKAVDVHGALKLNATNVELYSLHSGNNQIWYFKYLNNGFYSITSAMNPNISLDVHAGGMKPGTNIEIYKNSTSDNQQWAVRDVGNGHYSIVSKINGLNLEAVSSDNGSNIHTNKSNNSNNQRFKLEKHTNVKKYTGIDVSVHQGDIDWNKVSKTDLGFVIIRAGFGGDWTKQDDDKFIDNVKACEKYNIPYGLYLYSYAKKAGNGEIDGLGEAKHMTRLLNQISAYPYYFKPTLKTKVFIDIEDPSVVGHTSNSNLTALAEQFCDIMEKSGYQCGVYSYANLLKSIVNNNIASKYDIWVAEWGGNYGRTFSWALNSSPAYNHYSYKYWQFSSKGSYDGVSGYVDLDVGYDIFD